MVKKIKTLKVLFLMMVSIFGICICFYYYILHEFPDNVKIALGEFWKVDISLPIYGTVTRSEQDAIYVSENVTDPNSDYQASAYANSGNAIHLDFNSPCYVTSSAIGKYTIDCKLFGVIPVQSVNVEVVERKRVTPSGNVVGIYIETDGIMIIGTGTVTNADGSECEPAKNIVKSGDYIIAVNGESVNSKYDLMDKVNANGKEDIILTLVRNNETIECEVKSVETAPSEYKLGIWVRDNAVGIGTLTYYDKDYHFGALGHGITDTDTGILMKISLGKLYKTEIVSVTQGAKGTPGQLTGVINYSGEYVLGNVTSNSSRGVKGNFTALPINGYDETQEIEAAFKQEIEIGPAVIRCCIDNKIQEYDVEITGVNLSETSKGIELKVVDPDLLSKTGGIIQGMSGSPIIQNQRLVGAVTHVMVQDSTRGYGIFIEEMLGDE